jgi:hypothetical protein
MVDIEVLCSLHEAEIRRRNCAVSTLLSSGDASAAADSSEFIGDGLGLSLAAHEGGEFSLARSAQGDSSPSSASIEMSRNSNSNNRTPPFRERNIHTSNAGIPSEAQGMPPGQRLKLQRLTDGVNEALAETLGQWSSVVLDYNVYVAFFQCPRTVSTSFCLIRTKWSSTYLINVQVGFFSCPPLLRQRITQTLKWKIAAASIDVPTIEFGDVEDYQSEDGDFVDREYSSMIPAIGSLSPTSSSRSRDSQRSTASPFQSPPASPPLVASSQFPLPSPGVLPHGAHYVVKKVKPFGFPIRYLTTILLDPAPEIHVPDTAPAGPLKTEGAVVLGLAAHAANGIMDDAEEDSAEAESKDAQSGSALSLRLLRSYMRHHAWRWDLPSRASTTSAMRLIRGLRSEEGFVLVSASGSKSCTWLREIKLTQPNKVDDTTKTMACILQFSVTQLDDCSLQTELWMEPHYGFYHPSSRAEPLHSLVLFKALVSWLHCCDLHVISAIATFDAIRDIDLEKVRILLTLRTHQPYQMRANIVTYLIRPTSSLISRNTPGTQLAERHGVEFGS